MQSMWSRVKDVQDRLACAESTVGDKETLEGRLSQIQVCEAHTCCPLLSLDVQSLGLVPVVWEVSNKNVGDGGCVFIFLLGREHFLVC